MANSKETTKPKEGIENFIIKKLEKAHTVDEIRVILTNAGFSKSEIETGLLNVKKTHKTFHQDVAASNNFLPPLKKVFNGGASQSKEKRSKETLPKMWSDKRSGENGENLIEEIDDDLSKHIGLFAGRIRRKDFIVSMLFLFSLFFSILIIIASFIDALYPENWKLIGDTLANDRNGVLFLYLPILFAPFTLMFLSLVTRRLHDLEIPGILSFLYIGVFVFPFSDYAPAGMIAYDLALFVLWIFLMSKKGHPEKNKYGKSPASHGSTFKKVINLKQYQ